MTKKKLLLLLGFVVAIVLLTVLLVMPASAASQDFTSDADAAAGGYPFRIVDRTGSESITYYDTFANTVTAVSDGGNVYLVGDYVQTARSDFSKGLNIIGVPTAGVNPTWSNNYVERFFNVGGSGKTVTFSNVTLKQTKASQIMNLNAGGTLILNSGAKFTYADGVVNTTPMFILQNGSTMIVNEGAVLEQPNATGLDLNCALIKHNEVNTTLTINGGTFNTKSYQVWNYASGSSTLNLNADVLDPAKYSYFYNASTTITYVNIIVPSSLGDGMISKWGLVAGTNGKMYRMFSVAMDAATTGATVELLGNMTLTASVTVPSAKTVTIDGNGYTVSSGSLAAFIVKSGAKLTLTDVTVETNDCYKTSEKEGSVILDGGEIVLGNKATVKTTGGQASDNSHYITFRFGTGGKVTVNDGASVIGCGTVFSADGRTNNVVTMNGGSVETSYRLYVANGDGNVLNLNGGTWKTTMSADTAIYTWSGKTTINVNGTVITKNSGTALKDNQANCTVNMHELTPDEINDPTALANWKAIYSLWGKAWPYSTVAKIGTVEFATLANAFAYAQNGDTIVLIDNVSVDTTISLTSSSAMKLVLDGGNFTVSTNTQAFSIGTNVTLDLKNVTVKGTANVGQGLIYIAGGTLNLQSGAKVITASGTATGNSAYVGIKATADGAVLNMYDGAEVITSGLALKGETNTHVFNIYGGKITTAFRFYDVNITGKCVLNISGGTIESTYKTHNSSVTSFEAMICTYSSGNSQINITGGTIISNYMKIVEGTCNVTVSGGEIKVPAGTNVRAGSSSKIAFSVGKLTVADKSYTVTDGVSVYASNLAYGDAVDVNLYAILFAYEGGTVKADGEAITPVSNGTVAGFNAYKLTKEVNLGELTREIEFTFFVKDAAEAGATVSYSGKEYCDEVIADPTLVSAGDLAKVKALMNLCAAMQVYKDYDADNLCNASLQAADKALTGMPAATVNSNQNVNVTGSVEGVKVNAATLALADKVVVVFNVDLADGADLADYEITGGKVVADEDRTVIMTDGVFLGDIDDEVTVTVTKDGNTLTVKYSPFAYIARKTADGKTSAELLDVVKALYDAYTVSTVA